MFIEASFIIAKTYKQPTCLSTDEWINKMWLIQTKNIITHTHTHTHTQMKYTYKLQHGLTLKKLP